jgi:hypothetical protein
MFRILSLNIDNVNIDLKVTPSCPINGNFLVDARPYQLNCELSLKFHGGTNSFFFGPLVRLLHDVIGGMNELFHLIKVVLQVLALHLIGL